MKIKFSKNFIRQIVIYIVVIIAFSFSVLTISRIVSFHHKQAPKALTKEETNKLNICLNKEYPNRTSILHKLPYKTIPAKLSIASGSAILIDPSDGNILFEKNADAKIPPASMTKLVVMYIVFKEIETGKISFDDVVPLPPECWAVNMPRDASLMFLAEGQHVTLKELMRGLAIASGNDAAIAIAYYISGNVTNFVKRMNQEVQNLGLTHTHFVDSSGYSENDITTPREFVSFVRTYIEKYPQALTLFHSQKILKYPQKHNLPKYQQIQGNSQMIVQYNTNKLLGTLDGVDGIKTGFIYESGYNLALTAKRHNSRFLSITMKGPGIGSKEGNKYRILDGTTLMEYAFSHFSTFKSTENYTTVVSVIAGKAKSVNLIPVYQTKALTVPFLEGTTPQDAASKITITKNIPSYINGGTKQGTIYGYLIYKLGNTVLQKIPLVADRTITNASWIIKLSDSIAKHTI